MWCRQRVAAMKTLDFRGFVGQKVEAKPELSHTEYIAVSGVLGSAARFRTNPAIEVSVDTECRSFVCRLCESGSVVHVTPLF